MALQAILFDMDGTLADTESLGHLPAYNQAFRELGLPWRWSAARYRELLLLPTGRERVRYFLQHYAPPGGEVSVPAQCAGNQLVDTIHAVKSHHFNRLVARGRVPLRFGAGRLMNEALAAGVAVAVVTNATQATIAPVLRHALGGELRGRIRVFAGADGACKRKPAPDLYTRALRRMGLSAGQCIAIEDSAMGLAAARAAGITTLITVNRNTRDQRFPGASLVVSDLGEPERPFTVIAGDPGDYRWVTLPLLRELGAAERSAAMPGVHL